jgi:chromosomal replication initiation ATPase DnaA
MEPDNVESTVSSPTVKQLRDRAYQLLQLAQTRERDMETARRETADLRVRADALLAAASTMQRELLDPTHILETVCSLKGVSVADLRSGKRTQPLSWARAITAYIFRMHTQLSLSEIGAVLNRNHSTIAVAIKKVKRQLEKQPELGVAIGRLEAKIEAPQEAA